LVGVPVVVLAEAVVPGEPVRPFPLELFGYDHGVVAVIVSGVPRRARWRARRTGGAGRAPRGRPPRRARPRAGARAGRWPRPHRGCRAARARGSAAPAG